jgi:hypothetical protein
MDTENGRDEAISGLFSRHYEASMNTESVLVGSSVVVRSASEILSTLDDNGTLDGLPFMPEMLSWCGKSFRVQRRVYKTCVDGDAIRFFPANDVVVLEGPRCDGSSHGGCKHGCRIYWKEAWLRPVDGNVAIVEPVKADLDTLRANLKVKSDEQRYFCQSTELQKSSKGFRPGERFRRARMVLREIRGSDLGILRISQLLVTFLWQKALRAMGCDEWLRGPHKRTPTQSLNLRPGELVRVKSRAQIVQTLDHRMSNRGMAICYEMLRCCGREAEVRWRVDRLIDEKTGVMREITDTVTLSSMRGCGSLGEECLCYGEPGDCPRGELMYWREIWLERVNS